MNEWLKIKSGIEDTHIIQFEDSASLPISNNFVDTGYEPEKDFQPEEFSGLPSHVEKAKKYVGKTMEFSKDAKDWVLGELKDIDVSDPRYPYRNTFADGFEWFMFCRTCPETFKPETCYIQFGPGQIPAPEDVEPEDGTEYFYLMSLYGKGYGKNRWDGGAVDGDAFKNGIYLKESHIQEAVSVIRGIMGRAE